jgi:ribose transport system ATP-binding protein
MALIPEDRKQHGLLLTQAVRVNLTLGKIKELTSLPWWIDAGAEAREALDVSELMHVHSNGIEQAVVELSGGNQQKVVIGRWIAGAANVFLFDEPTRGIDVGAKAVVYHLLNELAQSGKSVVVVSSDLPELLGICDRIGVLSAGRLVEIFDRDSWSEEKIMKASFSGYME